MALCLAGRILSSDLINRDAFQTVISRIWKVRGEVEIEVINGNTYAFHFQFPDDRRKVLASGPWSFDDSLIVLEEPTGKGELQSLKFCTAEFWVQISNIPILCITKEIGRFLGSIIGDVREVDTGPSGDCLGKFFRVRVAIEVDKPLRRFLQVDVLGDREETVMPLQYERLPNFCFRCGILGHTSRDCPESETVDHFETLPVVNYGIGEEPIGAGLDLGSGSSGKRNADCRADSGGNSNLNLTVDSERDLRDPIKGKCIDSGFLANDGSTESTLNLNLIIDKTRDLENQSIGGRLVPEEALVDCGQFNVDLGEPTLNMCDSNSDGLGLNSHIEIDIKDNSQGLEGLCERAASFRHVVETKYGMVGVGNKGICFTDEGIRSTRNTSVGLKKDKMDGSKDRKWKRAARIGRVTTTQSKTNGNICGKKTVAFVGDGFIEESKRPKNDSTTTPSTLSADLKKSFNPDILFLSKTKATQFLLELYRVRLGFSGKLVVEKESEKVGSAAHPRILMENFREALEFCELEDMDFVGHCFTWSNKRDEGLIQERLDRGVCDFKWKQLFPSSSVENLDFWYSDHRAILVKVVDEDGLHRNCVWRRRCRFHFKACWADNSECRKLVSDNWGGNIRRNDMVDVDFRLLRCARKLAIWNQSNRWALRRDIDNRKKELSAASKNIKQGSWKEIRRIECQLDKLLEKEECYWKQRSRQDWLKSQDCNSKFFHWKASARKARNEIKGL
ncbi:hypothetical protein Dsin_032182 [Dipteronia sinensis]|uniref:CCHC-type domain-containing protein n=1 Tax=Dipteronia sinensis TaxID=43782 RepID=A0AAD9ZMF9_9ROSI|nr:hypothetical protein Dsin_032182 [Dipteronia sinensis]